MTNRKKIENSAFENSSKNKLFEILNYSKVSLNHLIGLSNKIKDEIAETKKDCLSKFSVEKYIENIKQYPSISAYSYVNESTITFCNDLLQYTNKSVLDLFHKLILVKFILQVYQQKRLEKFPEEVCSLYHTNFKRIVNDISSDSYQGSFFYDNDRFRKDIALCSLKMIPTGARKIHLEKLSLRFLFKGGLRQFVKGLQFLTAEFGSFKAILFEMHTDSKDSNLMAEFNEEGLIRAYKRIAVLFSLYPDVKGVFGSSWYYDPNLESISPRLAYLRRIPVNNGGKIFYLGPDDQSTKDATLKSPTRRKLYEEGKYIPNKYLLIWPRERLIYWAKNNRNSY